MAYVVISLRHGKKKQNVGSHVTDEERQAHEGRSENFALERCPSKKGKEAMNWNLYLIWADEILQIASRIMAQGNLSNGFPSKPAQALQIAHDLVSAHAANLNTAQSQTSE
jgi:hypothetical protein